MITRHTPETKVFYKGRTIVRAGKGVMIMPTSRYKTKTLYPTLEAATDALDRWKR